MHYARVLRLFADLELAHGDGRFTRLFRTLTKLDVLILGDWGPDRLTANQRRDLMEVVEDRYGGGSTLITSQLPVEAWHEVIGELTFADAILDRPRNVCLASFVFAEFFPKTGRPLLGTLLSVASASLSPQIL